MAEHATTGTPVSIDREPVDGVCPRCDSESLAAYPVSSEGGWYDVVKCQECLHSVSRERGPLLGQLQLLADQV